MFRVLCRVTDNAEERERIIKTPALRRIARISLPELGIIRDIGGYMSAKDDVERATFAIGLTSIPLRKLDAKKRGHLQRLRLFSGLLWTPFVIKCVS